MTSIAGTFSLIDHNEVPVTERTYTGYWLLVFFGFTNCGMVCPRALSRLSAVLTMVGDDRAKCIQPLYITVDPDRDSPSVMKLFLELDYPHFTGLTGTTEQIAKAKDAFNVFARRKLDSTAPDGYVVPHTAITYLLDPAGRYRTHWPDASDADEIAQSLIAEIDAYGHDVPAPRHRQLS